jgi:hypothetical protein
MKLSKKAITVLSFAVGACVFVSTALADMALGSGYDKLKASGKHTAAQMEKGLNNYTIETLLTLKSNEQSLLQVSSVQRIDTEKRITESTTIDQSFNGETSSHYSYTDPKQSIWKSNSDDIYYVSEFSREFAGEREAFTSPFQEEGAEEIEKIVDALVGSLKDYVQVQEKPEGGRSYSGALSEVQVPALVNAVTSFGVKQMIKDQLRSDQEKKLPELKSDIFVKRVMGSASENKEGLLENVTGEVLVQGKDQNGVPQDLSVQVVLQLTQIGTTNITKPDLEGKKVEKVSQSSGFSSKYIGKYRNNIIIEKDGQFVKIGERTLEITGVDSEKVTGRYYETVQPGFEAELAEPYSFTFNFHPDSSRHMSFFTYTNLKGEEEKGQLHPSGSGKIYLELGIQMIDENSWHSPSNRNFDGEFDRVFE